MAVLPGVTLSVTLNDLTGNAVLNGSLIITLCGYGQSLPRIAGTSMIAATKMSFALANGTNAGIKLWGNDQITPANTFYSVQVLDANRNIVQAGIYQFNSGAAIDLSTAAQVTQPNPPAPVPPGNFFADGIVPTGIIDGNNAIFTLPETPSPAASLKLYKNGVRLTLGVAYSLDGAQITYDAGYIPQPAQGGNPSDSHVCDFRYAV